MHVAVNEKRCNEFSRTLHKYPSYYEEYLSFISSLNDVERP